jgi:hypothetical protein
LILLELTVNKKRPEKGSAAQGRESTKRGYLKPKKPRGSEKASAASVKKASASAPRLTKTHEKPQR